MILSLEWKKLHRTGLFPGMLAGGLAAAAVPILNIAARPETFLAQTGTPLSILFSQNWSMLGMLNLFYLIIGACILYHIEYAGGAMEKMKALPISQGGIFAAKTLLLFGMTMGAVIMELLALWFCAWHWFSVGSEAIIPLLCELGYQLAMLLPVCILMNLISSFCRNLWIALGIGVICLFTATVTITLNHPFVDFFPFSLPMQSLTETGENSLRFLPAAMIESVLFATAAGISIPLRRRLA